MRATGKRLMSPEHRLARSLRSAIETFREAAPDDDAAWPLVNELDRSVKRLEDDLGDEWYPQFPWQPQVLQWSSGEPMHPIDYVDPVLHSDAFMEGILDLTDSPTRERDVIEMVWRIGRSMNLVDFDPDPQLANMMRERARPKYGEKLEELADDDFVWATIRAGVAGVRAVDLDQALDAEVEELVWIRTH